MLVRGATHFQRQPELVSDGAGGAIIGAGRELPAGLRLARLEAEGRVLTRRIVATK